MMKTICSLITGILIVLILCSAGCVSPPKATTTTSGSGSGGTVATAAPGETATTQAFVSEVTPFETAAADAQNTASTGYSVFAEKTPIPEDQSCLIYMKSQVYSYNKTAFSFNLKNPPMYINYSVIPTNITVRKLVTLKTGSKAEQTITYSDFSPSSWFEITVRNKTTGEIYLQDGFGPGKGYRTYTTGTLKVLKRDDLLVEFYGNSITATAGVWVKPAGNFDANDSSSFTECKYWDTTRNTLAYATATPTPTWAP